MTQSSYAAGSDILAKLARLSVAAKQVERLTKRIGLERCVERDAAVAAYLELPLVERKAAPAGVTPPAVAVAGTDGGRMQILDDETLTACGDAIQTGLARRAAAPTVGAEAASAPATPATTAAPAPPAATAPARTERGTAPAEPAVSGGVRRGPTSGRDRRFDSGNARAGRRRSFLVGG